MIAKSSIDKVIDRADIVEVIGQFLNLRRRGVNYLALCPFHNEKTPSFNVNPSRGIYKCFGCGRGGNVVTFIEEYEKFSFVEAIRWLADYYQIELEETESSQEFKEEKKVEESLRIVNDFAADYFHQLLHDNDQGEIIGKGYFTERGFTDKTIEDFKLGYCLDEWDAFTKTALANGYKPELLEKAGLCKNRNGQLYDNYKGRAIFPIHSNTGKIIGFGARILKKNEKAPKYLNTPENELYVKNKVLYGIYQARQAIRKADECFLVEGYADVVSMHQGGIENIVASSGTSLTDGQLKLISNLTKNLTFLYDGDSAGIKAALRGLDMALEKGFRVKLVLLPEGEDPDSFMQTQGEAAFHEYIEGHRQDVIQFQLQIGLKEAAGDPIKKNSLVNEMAKTISKINRSQDFMLQDYYIKECASALDIEEKGLFNLVNQFIREKVKSAKKQAWSEERKAATENFGTAQPKSDESGATTSSVNAPTEPSVLNKISTEEHRKEWQLVKILLLYGMKPFPVKEGNEEKLVWEYFNEHVDLSLIEDPLVKLMADDYLKVAKEEGKGPDEQYFIKHSNKEIRHKAVDLFYEKYSPNPGWKDRYQIEVPYGETIYRADARSTFAYFQLKTIRHFMKINHEQMKTATDPNERQTLLNTHMALQKMEKEILPLVFMK